MSRRGWLGLVAACGVVVLGLVGAAAAAAASTPVAAVNYEFNPSAVTVSVGATVVWTMSGDGHTVRSGTVGADNIGHPTDGPLNSGFKAPGESYAFTFAQAGTYPYFCEIHPEQMKGTITVVGVAASASTSPAASLTRPVGSVAPVATAGFPTQAVVTPPAAGRGDTPTSDVVTLVGAGILIAIAIIGVTLARARMNS